MSFKSVVGQRDDGLRWEPPDKGEVKTMARRIPGGSRGEKSTGVMPSKRGSVLEGLRWGGINRP